MKESNSVRSKQHRPESKRNQQIMRQSQAFTLKQLTKEVIQCLKNPTIVPVSQSSQRTNNLISQEARGKKGQPNQKKRRSSAHGRENNSESGVCTVFAQPLYKALLNLAQALDNRNLPDGLKGMTQDQADEEFAEVVGSVAEMQNEAKHSHSTLHTFVDGLFSKILCNNAYNSFLSLKRRVPEADFTLSEDIKTDKTAFEVCFDLSLIILCLFVKPSGASGNSQLIKQLSPSKKVCIYPARTLSNTALKGENVGKENNGPNADQVLRQKRQLALYAQAQATIALAFAKHIRKHQARTAQRSSSRQHAGGSVCLQSALVFCRLLEVEPQLAQVCKQKVPSLWSALLDVLPGLFANGTDEENAGNQTSSASLAEPRQNFQRQPEINLNQLILKQEKPAVLQAHQPGAGQTLESLKSRRSNNNTSSWSPKRGEAEDNSGHTTAHNAQASPGKQALSGPTGQSYQRFTLTLRQNLEKMPGFESGHQQLLEDAAPEELKEVDCEISNELGNSERIDVIEPGVTDDNSQERPAGTKVPPIMVNQIAKHHSQMNNPHPLNTNTAGLSSYLNMPHGQLNSSLRSGTHKQQASQAYHHQSQNSALATRSRLTRRQMSLSRQISTTGHSPIARHASIGGGEAAAQFSYTDQQQPQAGATPMDTSGRNSHSQNARKPQVPLLNMTKVNTTAGGREVLDTVLSGNAASIKAGNTMPFTNAGGVLNAQSLPFQAHAWMSQNRSPSGLGLYTNQSNRSPSNNRLGQMREYESMYGDNENGSFLFDQAQEINKHPQHSAEQELRNLATQLGEACLMTDLAALMTQKRDIELAESARKIVKQPKSQPRWTIANALVKTKRSVSANNMLMAVELKRTNTLTLNNADNLKREKKSLKASIRQTDSLRYRVAILNIVFRLLCEFSIDEARFLRLPVNLFACFLGSPQFREQRQQRLLKELKSGFKLKERCQESADQINSPLEFEAFAMSFDGQIDHGLKTADTISRLLKSSVMTGQVISQIKSKKSFMKVALLPETTIIYRVLNKISYVNEDILQSQTLNDLVNFTNRDQLFDKNNAYGGSLSAMSANRLAINGRSGSPLKLAFLGEGVFPTEATLEQQLQFSQSEGRNGTEGLLNGQQTQANLHQLAPLQDPKFVISNNGIVYEVPPLGQTTIAGRQGATQAISRRVIRGKLDSVLYNISRRIKYVIGQQFDPLSMDFPDSLIGEVTALSCYLKEQHSRTLLNQFIEVALQSVLMIKKALIDVALQSSVFVSDFSQNWDAYEYLASAKRDEETLAQATEHEQVQQEFLRVQQRHRELFAEFLNLLAILLRQPQIGADTLRLFAEVFVADELWLQSVKAYTISVFLSDLVSPLLSRDLTLFSLRSLETMRDMRLVTFDETRLLDTLTAIGDHNLMKKAQESIQRTMLCSLSTLRYFKAVAHLFSRAVKIHLADGTNFQDPARQEAQAAQGPYADPSQPASRPHETHNFSSFIGGHNGGNQTRPTQNHGNATNMSKGPSGENQTNYVDMMEQKARLFWVETIRYVLQKFEFLLTQTHSGLFVQYLQTNAVNHSLGDERQREDEGDTMYSTPMNLQITKSVLSFLRGLFALPNSFTKATLSESLMPFYIRTHYISFVKLYYKNFMYHQMAEVDASLSKLPTGTPEAAPASAEHTSQHQTRSRRNASLSLCKKHLECLFAIACTRSEATRRKLFQFKVVDFILQEIGLEYDLQQRRERFLKLSKQEQEKIIGNQANHSSRKKTQEQSQNKTQQNTTEVPKQPDFQMGANIPQDQPVLGRQQHRDQPQVETEQQEQPPPEIPHTIFPPQQVRKPMIPSLKIGGLGLSTLIKADGMTQEEQDVENLVGSTKCQAPPHIAKANNLDDQPQSKLDAVCKHSSENSHSSLIVEEQKDNSGKVNQNSAIQINTCEERLADKPNQASFIQAQQTQTRAPQPQALARRPMIPSLKVGGLGFSTLVKGDNGKTQEEQDVENLVGSTKCGPAPSQQIKPEAKSNQAPGETNQVQQPFQPPVTKKMPAIPSLKVGGLGFSTLIKPENDGKTQEEIDVENLVNEQKPQPAQKVCDSSDSDEYYAEMERLKQQPSKHDYSTQVQSKDPQARDFAVMSSPIIEQPQQRKPMIPSLKVGSLGFSTLIKEGGKTQEEQDVENLVNQKAQQPYQPIPQPQEQKKGPKIPSLKVGGLGFSTLIKDPVTGGNGQGKTQEELDVEQLVQQQKQGEPFQVQERQSERSGGQGQSHQHNNDGGDSDSSGSEEYYAELQRMRQQQSQQQRRPQIPSLGFAPPPLSTGPSPIPKLSIGGLGHSTLLKDNQKKTAEELDVEDTIANKPKNVLAVKEEPYLQDGASGRQNQVPQTALIVKKTQQSGPERAQPIKKTKIKIKSSHKNPPQLESSDGPGRPDRVDQQMILSLDIGKAAGGAVSRQDMAQVSAQQNRTQGGPETTVKMNNSRLPKSVLDQYLHQSTTTWKNQKQEENQEMTSEDRRRPQFAAFFGRHNIGAQSPDNVISAFAGSSQFSSIVGGPRQTKPMGTIDRHHGEVSPLGSDYKKDLGFRSPTQTEGPAHGNHFNLGDVRAAYPVDDDQVNALQSPPTVGHKGDESAPTIQRIKLKKATSPYLLENIRHKVHQFANSSALPREPKRQPVGSTLETPVEQTGSGRSGSSAKRYNSYMKVVQRDPDLLHKIYRQKQQRAAITQALKIVERSSPSRQASAQKDGIENSAVFSHMQSARLLEMTEEDFYLRERSTRPIYLDDELHVLMLSLMMCLLLKPGRGTLDDLYCSQFPQTDNENMNVLYLLHYHLSHPKNQSIVPNLMSKIEKVSPPLAGLRLLKLLCPALFDISLYGNAQQWKKIAEGAYGIVYECKTQFAEPSYVAIKQMHMSKSLSDRSVLHDIFTEITCLEEFRLEPCVTDLYDYGVDGSSYYIVMKRYSGSLRDWRLRQQPNSMNENLSLYLAIFYEILKCFKTIHSHKVTHYDIKCDNILIDFRADDNQRSARSDFSSARSEGSADDAGDKTGGDHDFRDDFRITVGDFGECWMYTGDDDEFCAKNRGTEFTKSPEMLRLAADTRKDTDRYDRRKKTGTNALSDVWSLGCLFYEVLTGDYLFDTEDFVHFYCRLTSPTQELFVQEKLDKIQNNVYLVDFLKFVLVRDNRMRPSLDAVLQRFELVYRLLASKTTGIYKNARFGDQLSPPGYSSGQHYSHVGGAKATLINLLEKAAFFMTNDQQKSASMSPQIKLTGSKDEQLALDVSDSFAGHNLEGISESGAFRMAEEQVALNNVPPFMKIMQDVFLAQHRWLQRNTGRAVRMGITHIIAPAQLISQAIRDQFDVFAIESSDNDLFNAASQGKPASQANPFFLMPALMDYLRKVALFKGRVLFLEWNSRPQLRGSQQRELIRECMLLCLATVYQITAYETYTLIKSQNLFFQISAERHVAFSKWTKLNSKVQSILSDLPRFSCICGACVIVLKRQFATYQFLQVVQCSCSPYYRNVEGSACPSNGCQEYINFLRTYYPQRAKSLLPEDKKLHWGILEGTDFVLGPNFSGDSSNFEQRQIAANLSKTIDKNCQIVSVTEKSRDGGSGRGAHNADVLSHNSTSQPRRFANTGSQLGHASGPGIATQGLQRWKVFKCRECQAWTHAVNEHENRYALLLNNAVRRRKPARMGLLTGQDDAEGRASNSGGVRVPNLETINLRLPF